MTVRYRPADSLSSPRFTGPRTFMRLPYITDLDGVDIAVIGIPTDGAVSYRSGARFGPEAIRSASVLLRSYSRDLDVDVAESLSIVDFGDAPTVPGYQEETLERVGRHISNVCRAGVTTLCLGGDHSMTLAELRAAAGVHGPLGLIHLDAHADVHDVYYGGIRYFHGTVFRRAVEEGLIEPARTLQAGLRGTLHCREDRGASRELGFEVLTWDELEHFGPEEFGARVRHRVGSGPTFLSFDIDFVDPAYAPGTGTPEVGGPSSKQALSLLGALGGLKFVGFDLMEVSPPYDPGGVTSWLAASLCHHMLCLRALAP